MSGTTEFEIALRERLALMRVTRRQLQQCLTEHQCELTPGFVELISVLKQHSKQIYLVSGGFRQMIEPLNARHQIARRVYANTLVWLQEDDAECIATYDSSEPTCRSGGKARVISEIKQQMAQERIEQQAATTNGTASQPQQQSEPVVIMIGDGATDMEARPPADLFIGFGGVQRRDKVARGADWFITHWQSLIDALQQQPQQSQQATTNGDKQ